MVRFLSVLGIAFGAMSLLSTAATASTIRYEFDVVKVRANYQELLNLDTGESATTQEKNRFTREYHTLSDYRGDSGHAVLEFELDEFNQATLTSCSTDFSISGMICQGSSYYDFVNASNLGFDLYGAYSWSLKADSQTPGAGWLNFLDDSEYSGIDELDGTMYFWTAPTSRSKVENMTVTYMTEAPRLAAVPLPSSYLLLAPVVLLPLLRRRKKA